MFDILGLGVCTIDTLVYLDSYPPEDSKAPILDRQRQLGGLTGVALVAAARMGCSSAYAGILGSDPLSDEVRGHLRHEGVDLSHEVRREGAGPVESIILVATGRNTRTVLHDSRRLCGADEHLPAEEVIHSARVLYVDHHGIDGMIRAARIARTAGIPVVADLEKIGSPRFFELLALVDHLILSRRFAAQLTGQQDPAAIIAGLWQADRQAVVITQGSEGAWYRSGGEPEVKHQPAFPVETVDSTGCGDVFHGVYAAGLAQGAKIDERVRTAAAAAALKAAHSGGQDSIPNRQGVAAFMQARLAGQPNA